MVFKPIISLIIAFLFHSVLIWAFKFSVLTSLISFLVCYTIEMSYFDQFSFNLDQVFKRFYYYYLKEEWYFPKAFPYVFIQFSFFSIPVLLICYMTLVVFYSFYNLYCLWKGQCYQFCVPSLWLLCFSSLKSCLQNLSFVNRFIREKTSNSTLALLGRGSSSKLLPRFFPLHFVLFNHCLQLQKLFFLFLYEQI